MDEAEVQRMIGANSARITILERSRETFERDVRTSLAEIKTSIDSSRGGWRAIIGLVGVLGAIIALLATLHQMGVHF